MDQARGGPPAMTAAATEPHRGLSPAPPVSNSKGTAPSADRARPPSTGPAPAPDHPSGPDAAEAYEQAHVHGVYEAIAPHFSATRHKPWPLVSAFLAAQRPGAVGYDVGCGNGKYLGVNPAAVLLGCDRSAALVALARQRVAGLEKGAAAAAAAAAAPPARRGAGERGGRRRVGGGSSSEAPEAAAAAGGATASPAAAQALGDEAVVADGLALPFREGRADFVISVAVIHHLSTRERRVDGIRQLLRCLKADAHADGRGSGSSSRGAGDEDHHHRGGGGGGGGRALVYVWALEQGSSRRGWDEGGQQDLLVPWVMKAGAGGGGGSEPRRKATVQKQDQDQDQERRRASPTGGNDKSGEQQRASAATTPSHSAPPAHTDKTFQRYYHLYRKGELEDDVAAAGGEVLESGYEKDNWWVIAVAAGAQP
ncbi:hypothetical protein NKR23_g7605 [Pleurostoma richardsiae]|uniref:Methyltransferase type 11 domain-containing protein n=1 Tax=Pleurostoma richardsiae TaxID=41990 RepID=A0AA38VGL5_9PEZI|nr:hypothetical protein NKR23_g7605 [Pleurostoma richardsiae]